MVSVTEEGSLEFICVLIFSFAAFMASELVKDVPAIFAWTSSIPAIETLSNDEVLLVVKRTSSTSLSVPVMEIVIVSEVSVSRSFKAEAAPEIDAVMDAPVLAFKVFRASTLAAVSALLISIVIKSVASVAKSAKSASSASIEATIIALSPVCLASLSRIFNLATAAAAKSVSVKVMVLFLLEQILH